MLCLSQTWYERHDKNIGRLNIAYIPLGANQAETKPTIISHLYSHPTVDELNTYVCEAGFTIDGVYGDYEKNPVDTANNMNRILIAKKPEN